MKLFLALLTVCFGTLAAAPEPQKTVAIQQTLSIIKPDAVAANHIGAIIEQFENAGLRVVAIRMQKITQKQAENFYGVHKDRPFFKDLVEFMTSGPVVVQVLEGPDAVALNRKVMGATNPQNAEAGTIRAKFGSNVQENAVHGSDSPENAKNEIAFFFKTNEIFAR